MPDELDILRNRAGHPQRAPDWRWWLAGHIRDNPHFTGQENDDPALERAGMFQGLYKDHQSTAELSEGLRSGAEYAEAYQFWHIAQSAETEDQVRRGTDESKFEFKTVIHKRIELAELEGMILTGSSYEDIAGYAAITPAGIRAYEELFFDVRSRLRSSNWVTSVAIGSLHQGNPLTMIPALIRAYGYQSRSLDVTRQVADTFASHLVHIAADADANRFFDEDRRSTNSMRAALASRMRPYNRYTYEKIIEIQNDTLEVDAKLKLHQGAQAEQELRDAAKRIKDALDVGYRMEPTNFAEDRANGNGPRLLVVDNNPG